MRKFAHKELFQKLSVAARAPPVQQFNEKVTPGNQTVITLVQGN